MSLPNATPQNPSCGTCRSDTQFDGDDFVCCECQLAFDPYKFGASFLDPDAKKCGASCDNSWHGDHKIKPGIGYQCGTCQLPTGHTSLHWRGCRAVRLPKVAAE